MFRNSPGLKEKGDEGYLLIGVLVLVFMVLLTLAVAAPRVAMELKHEKEIETQHRANQYVRGIRMFYRKFQNYPGSIKALESTNNQKFLRQHYLDPLTGKDDWKLIEVGKNKTQVKGFFGEDLPGLAGGLGAVSGMASPSGSSVPSPGLNSPSMNTPSPGGTTGSTFGGSGGSTFGGSPGTSSPGGSGTTGTSSFGGNGEQTPGTSNNGTPGPNDTSVSDLKGSGGPIMGVGTPKTGEAFLSVNEKTSYEDWEFLYDPRIEQLYAKGNLLGGGAGLTSGGGGSGLPGQTSGIGNGTAPGSAPSIFDTPKTPGTPGTANPINGAPGTNSPDNPPIPPDNPGGTGPGSNGPGTSNPNGPPPNQNQPSPNPPYGAPPAVQPPPQ